MSKRQRSLVLLAALLLPLAALPLTPACTSPSAAGGDDAAAEGGARPDVLAPPPLARTAAEADLAPKRKSCGFAKGAWPAETVGTEHPVGEDIPIKHVIVIMQENRSFDHYLGRLVAQGYYKADELDAPPAGWSNPDALGKAVVPHADDQHCYGVNHGWADMHEHYNGGKLDRFVLNNDPGGQRAFFYEDDTIIPFYYALASTFGVGDRYFASVMTSTWPNRLYAMAGTSFGHGDNSFVAMDTLEKPVTQIFSQLEAAGRTWKDYTDGPHQVLFFKSFGFRRETRDRFADVKCGLLGDIRNDTLPDVSYVMGDSVTGTSDEGPSALAGTGAAWVEEIIRTLFASPAWKDTAVFITYDENGGLADHVPPADACPPDEHLPVDKDGNRLEGSAFDKTGFRVPFIVVSPYARPHFVSHQIYDHTSILRFIEARFGLPAMTARDANATPPMEMFDFRNPPFLTPPTITARTVVSPAILAKCNQLPVSTVCPN